MNLNRIVAVAVGGALTLAACGSNNGTKVAPVPSTVSSAAGASASASASEGKSNDADVSFAQSMIPHHEQAIEMADMALDPAVQAGAKITALATKIEAAQGPEVKQLTALLTGWGKPVAMDMGGGHNMSSMGGMMSSGDMTALGKLKSTAFDKQWAAMMIKHHEGAIEMAKTVKAGGSNADILKLAEAVITAQQAEITELKPLAA